VASSRKKRQPDPVPEFFTERSLGKYQVPEAVRSRGFVVVTIWDVYGDAEVDDAVWIEEQANAGRVCLTKDDIRYAPGGKEAMERSKARVFYLVRQDLPGPIQVAWFMNNLNRLVQRSSKPGPFAYAVHENEIRPMYP
jgi:hypothetical protein